MLYEYEGADFSPFCFYYGSNFRSLRHVETCRGFRGMEEIELQVATNQVVLTISDDDPKALQRCSSILHFSI